MLNFITQNRRGTTEEWAKSLIIPRDGEVVLEECNDGITRIKIGDGHSLFKDLPYSDDKLSAQIRAINARIDNIVNLEEIEADSNTDPLAEVIDIRVGYDGIVYDAAGNAVRAIGEDVSDLRNSLAQFINAEAVDGLLYENNMLYLTAGGVVVSDPVTILAGTGTGGGGGVSTVVKLKNENGTSAITATKTDPVILKFTFTSTEDDIPTGDGTCTVSVGGNAKTTITIQQGYNEVDVTNYLSAGTNNVRVTCTDIYGGTRSLAYTVSVIELSITSTFDATSVYESDVLFRYTPYGQVDKTIHFVLDGVEIASKNMTASGKQNTQTIPVQKHGVHLLDVYATCDVNNSTIYSNHLLYDVMFKEEGNKTPMIASIYTVDTLSQGELVSIPYIVYDPTKLESDITLSVKDSSNEVVSTQDLVVDRLQQRWNTRIYPQGDIKFRITYGDIFKEHTVLVTEPKLQIEAETDSLVLHLSAAGRSNNEVDPAQWTYNNIKTTFEGFNWESNGWIADAHGDTCLRLNGDAKATIEFPLFEKDFKPMGKTIEFEFAIRDVNNRDAVVINCYSGDKGLKMTADTALFKSLSSQIKCNYKDEEKIRVAFTIDDNTSLSTRLITVYIDGVLSGAQQYPSTDDFQQTKAVNIKLGSELCGLDLYTVRVYDASLSPMQMTNNYIADIPNVVDKMSIFEDNDIYDEFNNVSYEKVKSKIPVITFTGKMPTYKGDKKKKSVRMKFEYPESWGPDYTALNFDELLDQIDVQGTSSQYYVRKNWKTKHPEKHQHMLGEVPTKVFCMKVDYAEATGTHNTQAANFVETLYSEKIPPQLNEAEEYRDKIRTTITGFPCVIFEKETEDSEPVFSSKANFNLDKGSEEAFGFTEDYDTECWEFANNTSGSCNFLSKIQLNIWVGVYTIGDNTETKTFTHCNSVDEAIVRAKEYLAEQKASNPDWLTASLSGVKPSWLDDFEARYAQNFVKDQTGKVVEYEGDPLPNITRFKEMHDWVVSTATYSVDASGGKTPITPTPLEEPITIGGITYTEDNIEYRLAKFTSEFTNYFDLHYASIYYVYTFFSLMTDQRAKNMFLTYWEDSDGVGRWYPYFYDNDTAWGINNEGALVFDYYHEDIDQLGTANVYNGQNSVLWTNFRQCFAAVIKETYRELRQDKLTYDKLINQFINKGSKQWSASIYNEDAEYKYITMARPSIDSEGKVVPGDTSNLYQIKGSAEHHFRYFVENRLNYCDSKWYSGNYPNDEIFLRIYTPQSTLKNRPVEGEDGFWYISGEKTEYKVTYTTNDAGEEVVNQPTISENNTWVINSIDTTIKVDGHALVVEPDPGITVTPFSNMYAGVKYKANGTLLQKRLEKNEAYKFTPPKSYDDEGNEVDEIFNDTETAIYGASEVSSLGDLSGLYCGVINVAKASKLVELIVGNHTPGYTNDNFRELSLGTNKLLKKLDVTNCTGLGTYDQKTLSVVGCSNIEEIYAYGTSITGVELPAAGYLRTMHLPATITNLNIQNQLYINDLSLASYDNVKTLCIDNCPKLNTVDLLNACKNVERVRLTNVHWKLDDVSFMKSLYHLKGLDEKGQNTDDAYLIGSVYIEYLTGSEYTELRSHYPYLEVSYGTLECFVTFKGTDLETVLHTQTIYNQGKCEDPVLMELVEQPTKEQTVSHTYTWSGWSTKTDGITVTPSPLLSVSDDLVLYPTFDEHVRNYTVTFYNNDESVLNSYSVPWGTEEFIYPDETPQKANVLTPDKYQFKEWVPAPKNITGDLSCYATYELKPGALYTVQLSDIDYIVDDTTHTLCITNYKNALETIIRVPSTYTIEEEVYTVNNIQGRVYELDHKNELTYTLDEENRTMSVTDYIPRYDRVFRIAPYYEINYTTYQVTSIKGQPYEDLSSYITVNGFRTNVVEHVELPEGLTIIDHFAFYNNKELTTITIPESVTTLGAGAFGSCTGLVDVYYNAVAAVASRFDSSDPYVFHDTFSRTGYTLHIGNKVQTIPSYVFSQSADTSGLYAAKIIEFTEDSVCTQLEPYAFYKTHCTDVNLPKSLQYIGGYAFEYSKLSKVIIPENVTTIAGDAFAHCSDLTYVYIPTSVTSIVGASFRYSWNIDFDIADGSIFVWKNSCLVNTATHSLIMGLEDAIIPSDLGITKLGQHCFVEVPIKELVIPEGVTLLEQYAVYHCTELTKITLPMSLTKLDAFALQGGAWQQITLPVNLQYIESYALCDNSNLMSLTIPSSVVSIAYEPFRGCPVLKTVVFETNNVRLQKPDLGNYVLFTGDKALDYIEVNWASDGTSVSSNEKPFENINADAPWLAGTTSGGTQIIPVTVKYTDKTLVYNIDGTITEAMEQGE